LGGGDDNAARDPGTGIRLMRINLEHPGLQLDTHEGSAQADGQRLAVLVEQNLDFVWRSLRRLGVPLSATDDATQQVWLVLSRRLPDIIRGQERAFLFGTALRVASDVRRRLARQREVPELESLLEAVDPGPSPHDLIDQRQARSVLDEILDALPDDLRVVFILYEMEEQTAAEIAALLALPAGTVASRLRRARAEFEQIVKRQRARGHIEGTR
jgi:RNA polymerase sigma-70 factor (ECF subfamily)